MLAIVMRLAIDMRSRRRSGVLDGAVGGHLGAERSRQMEDHVLRHHTRPRRTFQFEADRRRHPKPQLARGEHVDHLRQPDAVAGRAQRAVGGAVGIGPEDQLARTHQAALRQHLVTDARVPQEVPDAEALGEISRDAVALRHAHVRRREVVIQQHDHALGIEELADAELDQLERAEGEGLVRHHPIGPRGDVLPRADRRPAAGPGQHLLGHRHTHDGNPIAPEAGTVLPSCLSDPAAWITSRRSPERQEGNTVPAAG
jgi:hypothetical protein